jgi:Phytanoyl-CoA dioxygenase (PhyH)
MTAAPASPIFDRIADPDFWRAACPVLSIGEDVRALAGRADPGRLPLERARARMRDEGYFQGENETLAALAPALADGVRKCVELGLPTPFLFVFDQPWAAFLSLDPMLRAQLGPGYAALPAFWAWHVDPGAGQAGWRPHRDKGRPALAADGTVLSATVWIPLTRAEPLNGCIYLVPADRDPGYGTARENEFAFDLTDIRALPAEPGEYLCWSQAILHWGARTSRYAQAPRLSMALEFQRGEVAPFDRPLLRPGETPSFQQRLQLIAKQLLQYQHMHPLTPDLGAAAERLMRGA